MGRITLKPSAFVWTTPTAAGFLLFTLVLKTLQLVRITGGFSLVTFVQAWAPDVAFGVAFAGAFACGLSALKSRSVRGAVVTLYFVLMVYVFMVTSISYGFFLTTGANFSWSSLYFWLTHLGSTSRLVESEMTFGRVATVIVPVSLLLVAALVPLLPPVRRWLRRYPAISVRSSLITLGVAAAVFFAALLVPVAKGQAMAISRCVAVDIFADFFVDQILPEEELEISEAERLDSSLELVAPEDAPRPNVVLILFESLNWKSSDVYNPGLGTTPYLAELAKKSWVIDNHYTVVPHTTKALVAANCGIYPYLDTKPQETTAGILPRRCLAHVARSQGYATAFFAPVVNFEKRSQLVGNMGYEVCRLLGDMPQEGFEETNYFGKEDKIMVNPSLAWVDSVKDRPFLLTYLTLTSHHNYVLPQSYPYRDYSAVVDHDQKNFYNTVRYTDDFVKDVVTGLEERGLMDNTVVIVVGDHGEAFGEHGRRQHDLIMWEEGLHSFGLIYAPGLLPGPGRIEGFRSHLDLVPTLVDLLDLTVKKGNFIGTSLLGPDPGDRKLHFSCWYRRRCTAMREGPVKVIYHFGLRPMEVYDNLADPHDENNLAFTGAFDEKFLDRKEQEMLRWMKVVNQQYREWETKLTEGVVSLEEPPVENRLSARFGAGVELVGYEISHGKVRAGQDVELKYVFKSLDELPDSVKLFVHVNMRGGKYLNGDHVPGWGGVPVGSWEPGQYITDEHIVHIPGTWPTGEGKVYVGFWDKKSRKRLKVSDASGKVEDNRVLIATFRVKGEMQQGMTISQRRAKIKRWISTKKPKMETDVFARFGNRVALEGVNLSRMDVALAGTVEMTYLFWPWTLSRQAGSSPSGS